MYADFGNFGKSIKFNLNKFYIYSMRDSIIQVGISIKFCNCLLSGIYVPNSFMKGLHFGSFKYIKLNLNNLYIYSV